eukprot:gene19159-21079_t
MVQQSAEPNESRAITKTKIFRKQQNRNNNMDLGGMLRKTGLFGRMVRRFSQSEQDISKLHHIDNAKPASNGTERNSRSTSSVDDSCMVNRKSNNRKKKRMSTLQCHGDSNAELNETTRTDEAYCNEDRLECSDIDLRFSNRQGGAGRECTAKNYYVDDVGPHQQQRCVQGQVKATRREECLDMSEKDDDEDSVFESFNRNKLLTRIPQSGVINPDTVENRSDTTTVKSVKERVGGDALLRQFNERHQLLGRRLTHQCGSIPAAVTDTRTIEQQSNVALMEEADGSRNKIITGEIKANCTNNNVIDQEQDNFEMLKTSGDRRWSARSMGSESEWDNIYGVDEKSQLEYQEFSSDNNNVCSKIIAEKMMDRESTEAKNEDDAQDKFVDFKVVESKSGIIRDDNTPFHITDNGVVTQLSCSVDVKKERVKKTNGLGRRFRTRAISWIKEKTASGSQENIAESFQPSPTESHPATMKRWDVRRGSAPASLSIQAGEKSRLEDLYRREITASKERSNSLKSALKRRSSSDTGGASLLRVRFDLRERDSSQNDARNSNTTSEDGKVVSKDNDTADAKVKSWATCATTGGENVDNSATKVSKKKWKYVMRKFKITQPLEDFGSFDNKLKRNNDCHKTLNTRRPQNTVSGLDLATSINPACKQNDVTHAKYGVEEDMNEFKKEKQEDEEDETQAVFLNATPSGPYWSEMAPSTEKDGSSIPLLHVASAEGDKRLLKTLIGIGVDVDEKDSKGWPAIHYAINQGHFECAAMLLDNGVNLNRYTNSVIKEYCKTVRSLMIKQQR